MNGSPSFRGWKTPESRLLTVPGHPGTALSLLEGGITMNLKEVTELRSQLSGLLKLAHLDLKFDSLIDPGVCRVLQSSWAESR